MNGEQDIINVAVVNFRAIPCDKASNLARMKGLVTAAAKRGADLLVLPELCLTGCDFLNSPDNAREDKAALAEPVPGASVKEMAEVADEYGIYTVFGMPELGEDGRTLYNTAVAVGPGGYLGRYRKIHPWGPENIWSAKGDDPFFITTPWGPVGIGICYDSYQFPELIRYYVYRGARLYLNPSAVVEQVGFHNSREGFIRSYTPQLEYGVLANSVYVASANLTGPDITSFFGGGSMIIGPRLTPFNDPDVVRYAGDDRDCQARMHIATLDLSLGTRPLCVENPYTGVPDFRPDLYPKWYGEM